MFRKICGLSIGNNNLCRKLVSLLEVPIMFRDSFRVILVLFFTIDFNLLSCET